MCGRFTLAASPEAVRAALAYPERPNFPPRYNIAPTQPIAVVRLEKGERSFQLMRWGLIPAWAKDPRDLPLLINARAETAADKPAFRGAFRHRRCVIPADGWYEWQVTGEKKKRPWHIRAVHRGPVAFAGLWEHYAHADGSEIDTAAILTVDANATLSGIHDRMPAILPLDRIGAWLDPTSERPALEAMLRPAPEADFEAVPVSPAVGAVANDRPELIAPTGEALRAEPTSDHEEAPRQMRFF